MYLKELIKKIVYREKYSSETYISFLKSKGIEIGNDTTIYAPTKTIIDLQYPWMIKIGNHVRITEGVIILTHDYSWSVLKRIGPQGAILGASGKVYIGDNVFIGMNAIITRGVHIGDNVVIGAGSVVTRDCESNCVYAGNPARKICSIEDFYKKREKAQIEEAKELVISYYRRFNKKPSLENLHEYFMLFSNKEEIKNTPVYNFKMGLCENYDESFNYLENNEPRFSSFEEFLSWCLEDIDEEKKNDN